METDHRPVNAHRRAAVVALGTAPHRISRRSWGGLFSGAYNVGEFFPQTVKIVLLRSKLITDPALDVARVMGICTERSRWNSFMRILS